MTSVKGRYNDAKNDLLHAIWDRISFLNNKSFNVDKRSAKGNFSTTTEDLLSEIADELADFKPLTKVATIASLSSLSRNAIMSVIVEQVGRGGVFTYADSGYTVDNGIVFAATDGGYWVRQFSGVADAGWWGVTTTSLDNKSAILQAIASCSVANLTLSFQDGVFITNPLSVTSSVNIRLSPGTTLKLINSASLQTSELYVLKFSTSNSSLLGGQIDFNRNGQNRIAFNAAGGGNVLSYSGIKVLGSSSAYLTNINIDTKIINSVDRALDVRYVSDSNFPNVTILNSGTGAVFENCNKLSIGKILLTNLDNGDWRIYPHAFDLFNSSDITIQEITNQNQSGYSTIAAQTSLSDWFSGVTITSCDNVTINTLATVAKKDGAMMKSVGVSLLADNNLKITHLEVRRYTDVNLEVGGCFKFSVNDFLLDGEYQMSSLWPTTKAVGINVYNNGYYSDFRSRSMRQSTECTFGNGKVRRMMGYGGQFFTMSHGTFMNVDFIGNYIGAYFDYKNQNPSFAGVLVEKNKDNRFINCKFIFNESRGTLYTAGTNALFSHCQFNNNGQAKTNTNAAYRHPAYGVLSGTTYGFYTFDSATPGTERVGTRIVASDAFDSQTITNRYVSANPTTPSVISINDPSILNFGQTVKLLGAGAGGVDLIAQVYDINKDEVTLNTPLLTIPTIPGAGTISSTGTTLTGTGTQFSAEITGRFWIKVGSEYRQIIASSSNTSAVLGEAFSTDLSGQPFQIVSINIQQIRSQDIGIRFSNANDVLAVADNPNFGSSGNLIKNLQNDTGGNVSIGFDIKLPIVLNPGDFVPINGTPTVELSSATGRRKGWAFDANTNEAIQTDLYIPKTFADQLKVTYFWSNNGTGSGAVAWDCAYAFLADGADIGSSDVFAGLLPQTAPSREILKVSAFTTTISVTKDSLFNFRLYRNATSVSDTLPNDALLLMVVLSEG